MPESTALESARGLLTFWQKERIKAKEAWDAERIARCDHFIQQRESMIAALESAAKRAR